MIKNYWLEQAEEEEGMSYFRNKFFNPLQFPKDYFLDDAIVVYRFRNGKIASIEEKKGQE